MINYTDYKEGMYVKCVSTSDIAGLMTDITINKLYKIDSFWKNNTCDNFNHFFCAHMKDDNGYEIILPLYKRSYDVEKKINIKWYYLFMPKSEWCSKVKDEHIYFVPASQFEIDLQKYNL